MSTPKLRIVVDPSDQAPPLPFSSAVQLQRRSIPYGMYTVEGAVDSAAVIRILLEDFALRRELDQARLVTWLKRVRACATRAIVVQGTLSGALKHAGSADVLDLLIELSTDFQIPIWFADGAKNNARVIERLLLRVAKRRAEAAQAAWERNHGLSGRAT